jgi:G:T-mismatch repair DNA endonuclease (very short patch repair protein)
MPATVGDGGVSVLNRCLRQNCISFKSLLTQAKIDANRQRDLRSEDLLIRAGWRVLSVWECALKGRLKQDPGQLADQLTSLIRDNPPDVLRSEIRHR